MAALFTPRYVDKRSDIKQIKVILFFSEKIRKDVKYDFFFKEKTVSNDLIWYCELAYHANRIFSRDEYDSDR